MKIVKRLLGIVALIVVVIALILVFLPDKQYQQLLEVSVNRLTGRSLTVDSFATRRNLHPSIEIKNLEFANPAWAGTPVMFKADKLNLSINLLALFKGRLVIEELTSQSVDMQLLKNKNGETNWQFGPGLGTDEQEQNQSQAITADDLKRLVFERMNIQDFKLSYQHDSDPPNLELQLNKSTLALSDDGTTQSVQAEGTLNSLPLEVSGEFGALNTLAAQNTIPIQLKTTLASGSTAIDGELENHPQGLRFSSNLNVEIPKLDLISQLSGQKLPTDWSGIQASAQLIATADKQSVDEITMTLGTPLNLDIKGKVEDLHQLNGVDINLKADLDSINNLSEFSARSLPDIGPIKFKGDINSTKGKFQLENADLSYTGTYGSATLIGEIKDLIQLDQADFAAEVKLPNLSIVENLADIKLPGFGPIQAKANLISDGREDVSVKNLMLSYDHNGLELSSTGSIDSLIKHGGIFDLDITATLDSLRSLPELTQTELPDIGPVKTTAKLHGAGTELKMTHIKSELSDAALTGTVSGDLGSLNDLTDLNLMLDLTAPQTGELLSKFNLVSSATAQAHLSAQLQQQDTNIKVQAFTVKTDNSDIKAEFMLQNFNKDKTRPKFSGTLNINRFKLDDFFSQSKPKPTASTAPKSNRVLPDTLLPFHYLRDVDVDVALKISQLDAKPIKLADANFNLVSENGVLKLGPLDTQINGGKAKLESNIDAQTTPTSISLNVNLTGFELDQTGLLKNSELFSNDGSAFINLDLSGTGDSIAAIAAGANGHGEVYLESISIRNEDLKLVSSDFVTQLLDALNPLKEKSDSTEINCTALKFDLNNGHLTTPNGYVADAEKFSVTGEGDIQLKDETLNLKFNSSPKEGLGLSVAELARIIQLKGDLAKPTIALNPEGLLEVGASIGAAIATGGVSLLAQGQFEKLKARSELCAKVFASGN